MHLMRGIWSSPKPKMPADSSFADPNRNSPLPAQFYSSTPAELQDGSIDTTRSPIGVSGEYIRIG